jgi:hypothetical protein
MRDLGVPLLLVTIKARIIALIQIDSPEIFEHVGSDGSRFIASDTWVRKFVKATLGWTFRKATRAAQHLPQNWGEFVLESWLRHAIVIWDFDIPGQLRVNADQTQVIYQQPSGWTYDTRGTKQVHVIGKDEKRAIMVLVAISESGKLLPFQAIFKGRSSASLHSPSHDDPELKKAYKEAMELGFHFEYAGDTYWSTLETMKSWVDHILAPYFTKQKALLGLQNDHECILQLDVWSVHASQAFRQWMWDNHPKIILIYVPGGCTRVFQPCNVGIQWPLKQALISCQNESRVLEVLSLLDSGKPFEALKLDESLKFLRDRIPSSLVRAYNLFAPKSDFIRAVCTSFICLHNDSNTVNRHSRTVALMI